MSTISDKKKKIIEYLVKLMKVMDPSGINAKRWSDKLTTMGDKEFDTFMNLLRDKKYQISMTMPNMSGMNVEVPRLLAAAKMAGVKIFHKLWLQDDVTGEKYLTNDEYPVLCVSVRRMEQFLDKKLSVPNSDTAIDGLTGQVSGRDKALSITTPEIQVWTARGLSTTLMELMRIRGGDINAYGEYKRQLEETGACELASIDPNSRTRTSVMMGVLLKGMHLENNI